jgi:hypothetical protein
LIVMNALQQKAFDVGQLASRLLDGYLAFSSTTSFLTDPGYVEFVKRAGDPFALPVTLESILRKDGSVGMTYWFEHYRRRLVEDPVHLDTLEQTWLSGVLLTLGDALAKPPHRYLDRLPDLELVRHLRNGVAHGNRFNLRRGEPSKPAYFHGPPNRYQPPDATVPLPPAQVDRFFQVTPAMHGDPVLFNFIGAGDVCDLLQFIGWRLVRIANGDPRQDMWPQTP